VIHPFNNPRVAVQSWYVIALSKEIKRGRAIARDLLDRRVAVYRGEDGIIHALDARCPHLGANLGLGTVVENNLRCAFHHWSFSGNGRCAGIPYMDSPPHFAWTFSYPIEEKYGAVWIFNGPQALFPIPVFAGWNETELLWSILKPQVLSCHPHVVTCNGLDVQHFKTVHELTFVEEPVLDEPDNFRVRLRMQIKLKSDNPFERALRLFAGETFPVVFTTWGGNLATIEGQLGPVPLLVLFSHRPLEEGRSASRTFIFAPKQQGLKRLLHANRFRLFLGKLIMGYILIKDRLLLDELEFRGNLVRSDAPLAAFMRQVNRMKVFDARDSALLDLADQKEAL
jgi:phenylpropionate dioxygenase-like ring-hydroxylating dioxygenase large terminal subunit